ncbi:MAG: winged helix-turn-helix domain-containing protein [Bacteroidota bacterium]
MAIRKSIYAFFLLLFLSFVGEISAQDSEREQELRLAMRMIGHEVLLSIGDSSSRVMPIKKEGNRYRIEFETEFQFDPRDLVRSIDTVMKKTHTAESYLVEVEDCRQEEVIYSYKIWANAQYNLIPCGGRVLDKDCYSVLISILDSPARMNLTHRQTDLPAGFSTQSIEDRYLMGISLLLTLVIFVGLYIRAKNQTKETSEDPNLVTLGTYRFDKRNMLLSHANERTELTSKEADLLMLLHSSVNNTLKRDHLLHVVWGDEGDYVGRTLDVYISKLRKKLAKDEGVKIVNVRGIGYKLVVNE